MTLDEAIAKVLEGFEKGVFVREIKTDHQTGWAIKIAEYIAALGVLAHHVEVLKEPK